MITLAATLLRIALLAAGVQAEEPSLSRADALEHATAAVVAESRSVPAEVLLALAYRESRYSLAAGPMCGALQVALHGRECAAARSSVLGSYEAGAKALREWLVLAKRLGKPGLRTALTGYSEGVAAARRGSGVRCRRRHHCDRATSVLVRARRIAGARHVRAES